MVSRLSPGHERAMFWTMAFACFAAAMAGIGGRAAHHVADRWAFEAAGLAVVRVLAADDLAVLGAAERTLAAAPDVAAARSLTPERAAGLLQDQTGALVNPGDLPPLRLIEVDLRPNAAPGAERRLEQALSAQGIAAEVLLPGPPPETERSIRIVRFAATAGAAFVAAVMAAIIGLAARALAHRRRDYVTVMADLGATRTRAAGEVGQEAARSGLIAGALGAVAAAGAALLALYVVRPGETAAQLLAMASVVDLAPLLATPVLAALVAGAGARASAERQFARAARLA